MIFEEGENCIVGSAATSGGSVHVTNHSKCVVIEDAEEDQVGLNRLECTELWPALKAFAETGDIRNADYGPRVRPLPITRGEDGGNWYGGNFLSLDEDLTPCGIAQEIGKDVVKITAVDSDVDIILDRDTAERLALVLLRFARTGRIEEQPKDVGETIDPTANCE